MAISRIKTWVAGEVLYAADLNAEFNNPINNALSLISPLTSTLDASTQNVTAMGAASTVVAGTGAGRPTLLGVLSVNTTSGTNGADSTDDTLQSYSLPANSLSANGKAVRITATGVTAANANTKTIKLFFGATAFAVNAITTAPNSRAWHVVAIVVRTGATTQLMSGVTITGTGSTATVEALSVNTAPAETLSAAVTIRTTGASAASAAADITGTFLMVEMIN